MEMAASNPPPRRFRTELTSLLFLATPIIIAQMAQAGMGFVDAVMAGQVSPEDLAAIALGVTIWVPVFLLMTGTLLATTPKVAQRFGADRQHEIGPLVRQAFWLALIVSITAACLIFSAKPVMHWMKVDPQLIDPGMRYLYGVACGLPGVAFYQVLRCMSDGLGSTLPSMCLALTGLALKVPLNYILIHGLFGLPALGGPGCGIATFIVMWSIFLGMLLWVRTGPRYRSSRLFEHFEWPKWSVIRRLLAIGLPIGISIFAESSVFSLIGLLIGSMGATLLAGHQIALNWSSLMFMVPLSLGVAVTVRVGQNLGRQRPDDARFSAMTGMLTAASYAIISSSSMMWLREPIAELYTNDVQVIAIAASLLVFAALFQFSDAIQVTAAGALRGYQDTRMTMIITLCAYWGIGLPVGYVLGMTDWIHPANGPRGLWQGLIVGLTCAAIMLSLRLRRISRRRIQVANAA